MVNNLVDCFMSYEHNNNKCSYYYIYFNLKPFSIVIEQLQNIPDNIYLISLVVSMTIPNRKKYLLRKHKNNSSNKFISQLKTCTSYEHWLTLRTTYVKIKKNIYFKHCRNRLAFVSFANVVSWVIMAQNQLQFEMSQTLHDWKEAIWHRFRYI